MTDLTCGVVLDLLPLYAEGMLGDESKEAVTEHLKSCEACGTRYREMTRRVPVEAEKNLEQAKPLRRFRFHMLLNILGFPLWLPLLLTALAVTVTLYLCVWVAVITLWCVPLSLSVCSLASVVGALGSFMQGMTGNGFFFLGCMAGGTGLAVLSFFPCLWLSKRVIRMTRFLWRKILGLFIKNKEVVAHA